MPDGDGTGHQNGQQNDQGDPQNTQRQSGMPETWEAFLEAQSGDVKALFETHVGGLKSALQNERDQHRDLAKQLREATEKLEKGSDARKELEALGGQLEAAEQRAAFYEDAAKPEIGCTNAKLAYLAAHEIEAFDRRGNVNWDVLKKDFPELFKRAGSGGNAGNGTEGGGSPDGADMNAVIRRAAGR